MSIKDRLNQIFGSSHNEHKPAYARPETIADQDALFELYNEWGIVNGTPGTLNDDEITNDIDIIMHGDLPHDQKIFLLQALDVSICNNHIAGTAARGVEQVSDAIREVMYEAGVMVRRNTDE
jgi:hypothetical protein